MQVKKKQHSLWGAVPVGKWGRLSDPIQQPETDREGDQMQHGGEGVPGDPVGVQVSSILAIFHIGRVTWRLVRKRLLISLQREILSLSQIHLPAQENSDSGPPPLLCKVSTQQLLH